MSKIIKVDNCYDCPMYSYCLITNIENDHESIDPNCGLREFETVCFECKNFEENGGICYPLRKVSAILIECGDFVKMGK